jgi:hypothetical protein
MQLLKNLFRILNPIIDILLIMRIHVHTEQINLINDYWIRGVGPCGPGIHMSDGNVGEDGTSGTASCGLDEWDNGGGTSANPGFVLDSALGKTVKIFASYT